jgi:hypothetical protein
MITKRKIPKKFCKKVYVCVFWGILPQVSTFIGDRAFYLSKPTSATPSVFTYKSPMQMLIRFRQGGLKLRQELQPMRKQLRIAFAGDLQDACIAKIKQHLPKRYLLFNKQFSILIYTDKKTPVRLNDPKFFI